MHRARRLRLLSYNIQTGISYHHYGHYLTRSWRHLLPHGTRTRILDRIAACLNSCDVVALQETDAGSLRTGFTNQTEYLAHQSCFPCWLDHTNRHLGQFARHSNGLLSRFEAHNVVRHQLPGLPGRGALVAEFGKCMFLGGATRTISPLPWTSFCPSPFDDCIAAPRAVG